MIKDLEQATRILAKEFGKDRKVYLATSVENIPYLRIVNSYYSNKSFYLVAHETSKIVQQIQKIDNVSICATASFHKFHGKAVNIGHPLKKENEEIRNKLTDVFSDWYFERHDESDPQMCIIQIMISTVFTYANKVGFDVDFEANEVNRFPFAPNG